MIIPPFNFIQRCLLHQRENYQFKLVKWHKLLLLQGSPRDKKHMYDVQSSLSKTENNLYFLKKEMTLHCLQSKAQTPYLAQTARAFGSHLPLLHCVFAQSPKWWLLVERSHLGC